MLPRFCIIGFANIHTKSVRSQAHAARSHETPPHEFPASL